MGPVVSAPRFRRRTIRKGAKKDVEGHSVLLFSQLLSCSEVMFPFGRNSGPRPLSLLNSRGGGTEGKGWGWVQSEAPVGGVRETPHLHWEVGAALLQRGGRVRPWRRQMEPDHVWAVVSPGPQGSWGTGLPCFLTQGYARGRLPCDKNVNMYFALNTFLDICCYTASPFPTPTKTVWFVRTLEMSKTCLQNTANLLWKLSHLPSCSATTWSHQHPQNLPQSV